ncbi:MAG: hypothetical protein HZA25_01405 [Candidatus Niyogibacteria bacterium]|nr:hypothetical protein [Candidatus Niyogibacteria bacterium]
MGSTVRYIFPVNYTGETRAEEVVIDGRAGTEASLEEAQKRVRVIANMRLRANEVAVIGEPELNMVLPLSETTLF